MTPGGRIRVIDTYGVVNLYAPEADVGNRGPDIVQAALLDIAVMETRLPERASATFVQALMNDPAMSLNPPSFVDADILPAIVVDFHNHAVTLVHSGEERSPTTTMGFEAFRRLNLRANMGEGMALMRDFWT